MLFHTLRRMLFCFDPETAHAILAANLNWASHLGVTRLLAPFPKEAPVNVMGLTFPNAIGLAAGFDKNGTLVTPLGGMGFGHIEIGTITPKPQPGNPKPRLHRLVPQQAIINRMGFNNQGIEQVLKNLHSAAPYRLRQGILGINVGKNALTPMNEALSDYDYGVRHVYNHADYIAINISSPNTKNLRDLQAEDAFKALLVTVTEARKAAQDAANGKYVPIAVKLAPDLEDDELRRCVDALVEHGIDGVIATNTTLARPGLDNEPKAALPGGLSGAPLAARSTEVVRLLAEHLDGALPIIASGGVLTPEQAVEKMQAGASLVQLFTGFIYNGPQLIVDSVEAISDWQAAQKVATI